ncbi:MAG: hypothetical protein K8S99_15355 [Planctomycetes bacterium]|nr:hypothetical protein [Planctomycetota bacterium]
MNSRKFKIPEGPSLRVAAGWGFTLMELMFVIGLIGVLMAITVPGLKNMRRGSQIESGVNSINVAAMAARAYSFTTRNKQARFVNAPTDPYYRGAAILFSTSNELRLIENIPMAVDQMGVNLKKSKINGYGDIYNREYITVPSGTGVVGIAADGTGTVLLPPPFTLRFTERGLLSVGDTLGSADMVYYDGNMDGRYDTASSRPLAYDPGKWDPEMDASMYQTIDTPSGARTKLPFECIESVVGVIVYSKTDLMSAGLPLSSSMALSGPSPDATAAWIAANGRAMFFSRYTGTWMRER